MGSTFLSIKAIECCVTLEPLENDTVIQMHIVYCSSNSRHFTVRRWL